MAAELSVVLQDGAFTYVSGAGLITATDAVGVQAYYLTTPLGSVTAVCARHGNALVAFD